MPSRNQPRATDEMALTLHERATVERDSHQSRPLTSKPQPLYILPSFWFWQELWRTEPQLYMFFTFLWTIVNAPLVFLIVMYLRPFWLAAMAMFLIPIVSMGLVEKSLRLLVVIRRRRLTAARRYDAQGELPANVGELVDERYSRSADER